MMEEKKRQVAQASVAEQIDKKKSKNVYSADASFLVLQNIEQLLIQILNNQLESAGKAPVEKEELPRSENKKGRVSWLFPNRKKN